MNPVTSILDRIQTVVAAVQIDGMSAFVDVLKYPTNVFDGLPSATIRLDDMPSSIATNVQNRRSYTYELLLYFDLDQSNAATSYANAYKVLDAVLDALERDNDLNGGVSDFLIPVTGRIEEGTNTGGTFLFVPLAVVCQKDVFV